MENAEAPVESGTWPADAQAIAEARMFLVGCRDASVVVACDSDVDGLSAAVIVERAVTSLGGHAHVLPVRRGEHVHHESMRERIRTVRPNMLVVVDMGSRPEAILPGMPTLVIDHHAAAAGVPPDAIVVNGFDRPPVAPSSVLAFVVSRVAKDVQQSSWLAALGAVADLGSSTPFKGLLHGKISDASARKAASLLNAARRAPDPDPAAALDVLRRATGVHDITSGRVPGVEVLKRFAVEVRAETDRCSRVAPRIAGNVALLRFASAAQVHPVVAIRWARRLRPRIVLAANDGYLPGRTNFAVRCDSAVDLLAWLREIPFTPSAEAEYGNGHPRATGGSLSTTDFDRFCATLGLPDRVDRQP